MSNELLDKMDYVLVRIEEGKSGIFEELNSEGFSMMNIDVDGDNIPFALFIKDKFTKKRVLEWFINYTIVTKGRFRTTREVKQVIIYGKNHPLEWLLNFKAGTHIINFYNEIYQKIENIDYLRY